jgi:hypothetical protein
LVESDSAGGYIVTLLSITDLRNQQSLKAHGLAWRLFSASEVLLGAVIVIGHNVFHVLPNEVPILFVLGLVSVRFRDGGWSAIGFSLKLIVANARPSATGSSLKLDWFNQSTSGHCEPAFLSGEADQSARETSSARTLVESDAAGDT